MDQPLDITLDEAPLFLAEAEEQLQTLGDGLVWLEREDRNPQLLQAMFRAAHTLKGMAGAINHHAMSGLVHALETILDDLRQGQVVVTSELVDTCLIALDTLRVLCVETVERQATSIEVAEVTPRLLALSQASRSESPAVTPAPVAILETSASPTASHPRANLAEKTVRTSVERLDNLMNLVGELITDRNRLSQLRNDFENRFRGDPQADNLGQTVTHLVRLTDQLQEEVMRIRLLPIASVFSKFPRLVRDLARQAEKQVSLVIRGEDTELDRSVLEAIGDPLIHLLRNAVDHGLESPGERQARAKPEQGVISLTARHAEGHIVIVVEDDGRGIDLERVKARALAQGLVTEAEAAALSTEAASDLIFAPGLSTAAVVSEVSGRGVGLDIVRTNIERLNGTITVEAGPGRGTRFQITLPLTLAIIPTLLVHMAGRRPGLDCNTFAIPLASVIEALHLPAAAIHPLRGKAATQLRGRVLPLVRLNEALALPSSLPANRSHYVVAVRWGKAEMGIIVDALVGEQELVVKALGAPIGETPGVSGAAILGDGRVALIVDVPGLFKLAGV